MSQPTRPDADTDVQVPSTGGTCSRRFSSRDAHLVHILETRHGLTPCAACDALVAPTELVEPLQRALHRFPQHAAELGQFAAHDIVSPIHTHTVESSHASDAAHNAIPTPPDACETPTATTRNHTDRQSDAAAAHTVAYRCMSCLNTFPTWTRLTKHVDSTDHTLAKCATCLTSLKCYGPLRPHRHCESTGHTGLWGPFYNRRDYAIAGVEPRTIFVAENRFTGHSVLQFECTCGIRFVNEAHLAIHLREAHHVTSIPDKAVCATCEFSDTLQGMATHLMATLDLDGESARHEPVIDGFDALCFLAHRPLCAIGSCADTSPPATAASASPLGGQVASTQPDDSSPFVVLYQCPECYLLFSSWDRVEEHSQVYGHCRSYCVSCRRFLPSLRCFSNGERGRYGGPQQGQGAVSVDALTTMSLREYLEHIQRHPNVLGCPASREALEVLYHRQQGTSFLAPCAPLATNVPPLTDRLDVPVETQKKEASARDPVMLAFQCSTCKAVFLHYGSFVHHILTLRHGERVRGSENDAEVVLDSLFPMTTYQVKFTSSQLCQNFGFTQCPSCLRAFPPSEIALHRSLCQQAWMAKDSAAAESPRRSPH